MGEIADMIIEGELCQECGVYMGGESGYPRSCPGCLSSKKTRAFPKTLPVLPKVRCKICNRKVKAVGLADHMRDSHNITGEADD